MGALEKDLSMAHKQVASMVLYRWLVFAALALGYFFVYFHRFSPSVVANDLMRDFHVKATALAAFASIYFYCYAAMQFPAGLLSDSVGPRRTMAWSLVLAAGGGLLFALAPDIRVAMVARVLVGLGVSMVFIPALKIISQWFRAREFALMSGLLNGAGGAGVLGATAILGRLAMHVGWRVSFGIIAGCTVGIIIAIWLVVWDRPADKGWPSIAQLEGLVEPPAAAVRNRLGRGMLRVVRERAFWPVAGWFFFDCGIFFAFGGLWSGPYLQDTYGMTKGQSGDILGMMAWGMIVGGPLLGAISQRVLRSRRTPLMLCASLLTLLLLVLNICPSGLSVGALASWFFLFSVCSSAIASVAFTTTKELFPVEMAGTAVGMVNFFPFLGGAVFMVLLGRVLDHYVPGEIATYPVAAYRAVLFVLLLAAVASLACTLRMKETYRR
jgi:sugar phosphate permease